MYWHVLRVRRIPTYRLYRVYDTNSYGRMGILWAHLAVTRVQWVKLIGVSLERAPHSRTLQDVRPSSWCLSDLAYDRISKWKIIIRGPNEKSKMK